MSAAENSLKNCYSTTKKASPGVIFGIGHPLLDISADVDEEFLNKWELKPNDMILCDKKRRPLYEELENYQTKWLPGGASMNAIRSAQWALKNQGEEAVGSTFCTGTVGIHDKNAQRMESAARYAGVDTKYFPVNEEPAFEKYPELDGRVRSGSMPTGVCGVLLSGNGKNRSLVTNLAAARIYLPEFLDKIWQSKVQPAQYFYSPGFFLTTEDDNGIKCLRKLANHCIENNKTFIGNMSAPFLCTVFRQQFDEFLSYCDVLFGNDYEYLAWAEANPNLVPKEKREDLHFINQVVANLPKKNSTKPRLAITTRGDKSTIVSQGNFPESGDCSTKAIEFPIIKLTEEQLVDTNGAGDAFVAGFLCGLTYDQSIENCIKNANQVASSICQMPGCTFPEKSLLKF